MRLDKFLLEHFPHKFQSRTKAQEAIEKGYVLFKGKASKASDDVENESDVTIIEQDVVFVSNGGYKLERALSKFSYDCVGKIYADIGASTGGFTDCLLQRNAKKVYCVDVGESLLDKKIASDKCIVRMENTNARFLKKDDFDDCLDGIVVDVSFISLSIILPVLSEITGEEADYFVLIKPQFECGAKLLGKNGILKDKTVHKQIISKIYDICMENRLSPIDIVNAPLKEKKNVEYIIWLKKNAKEKSKEYFTSVTERWE